MGRKLKQQQKLQKRLRRRRRLARARSQSRTPVRDPALEYMRLAGKSPLLECWLCGDLVDCREESAELPNLKYQGHVAVARNAPEGIAAAVFSIDLNERGLSDVYLEPAMSLTRYHDILECLGIAQHGVTISLDMAALVILDAASTGEDRGFQPPQHFRAARQLLRGYDPEFVKLPPALGV